MTAVELVIFGMATWRIAHLVTQESGPFQIFRAVREIFGIGHDMDGNVVTIPDGFFGELLSCVWCFSVWVGIFWTVLYAVWNGSVYLALPFCLSAMAVLVEKYT